MKWPQLRADRYVWEDVSKVEGIKDAVGQDLSKLPFFDPFEDIDTISEEMPKCRSLICVVYLGFKANMELRVEAMNIVMSESKKMNKAVEVFLKLLMTKKIFDFVIRFFYRK